MYGIEAWTTMQLTPQLRLALGGTVTEKDLRFRSGTRDTRGVNNETLHNDPDYQIKLRASYELSDSMQLDLQLRRIAPLEVQPVPGYTGLDLWWAWYPVDNVELSLTGRNLLDKRHPEFGGTAFRGEFSRSVALGLRWSLQ